MLVVVLELVWLLLWSASGSVSSWDTDSSSFGRDGATVLLFLLVKVLP